MFLQKGRQLSEVSDCDDDMSDDEEEMADDMMQESDEDDQNQEDDESSRKCLRRGKKLKRGSARLDANDETVSDGNDAEQAEDEK